MRKRFEFIPLDNVPISVSTNTGNNTSNKFADFTILGDNKGNSKKGPKLIFNKLPLHTLSQQNQEQGESIGKRIGKIFESDRFDDQSITHRTRDNPKYYTLGRLDSYRRRAIKKALSKQYDDIMIQSQLLSSAYQWSLNEAYGKQYNSQIKKQISAEYNYFFSNKPEQIQYEDLKQLLDQTCNEIKLLFGSTPGVS